MRHVPIFRSVARPLDRGGRRLALFALTVVAFLVVSGCSGASSTVSATSPPSSVSGVTSGPGTSTAPGEVVVAESGFSSYDTIDHTHSSWAVVLDNPNAGLDAVGVNLLLTFRNQSGMVLDTQTEQLSVLPPGRSAWAHEQPKDSLGPAVWNGGVAAMTANVTVTSWRPKRSGSFAVGDVRMDREAATRITTTRAVVTSSYAGEVIGAVGVAVFRDAAGKILGGSRSNVIALPAAKPVEIVVEEWEPLVGVTKAEIVVLPPE